MKVKVVAVVALVYFKMLSHSSKKGRGRSAVTIFHLLVASVLLSGVFQSSSQCFVSGKEDEKKDDKDKDKNKKKDYSESPSAQPSTSPTHSPSGYPTTQISSDAPSTLPTFSPTRRIFEAQLPEIKIDILTFVDDIFSFAAILLDGDANGMSDTSNSNNKISLNDYFESFVEDLLIASEVVTSSSLDSVDVNFQFLPLDEEIDNQGTVQSSLAQEAPTSNAITNATPVRIAIKGKMLYHFEADEGDIGDDVVRSNDVLLLEDNVSHALAVYFSFWRTDEMVSKLSEYGLTDPQITAVSVDDKLILVAANSNPKNNVEVGNSNNVDDVGDDDSSNLLVVPSAITNGIENESFSSTIESGCRSLQKTIPFLSLVAMIGSTTVFLIPSILN